MHRRFLRMLVAAGLFVGLTQQVQATHIGEICVVPNWEGTSVTGGTVAVSCVGAASERGYSITGKTGNWIIAADEVFFPETVTWVRKHAIGEEITQKSDESGAFCFQNLKAGLYLVTQKEPAEGYAPFQPFLVELPVGGEVWKAEARPKLERILSENPKTGDHPAPIIAAMGLVLSFSALLVLSDRRR